MRILLVTDKYIPEKTTVGKIVDTEAWELRKLGHEVLVTCTRPADDKSFNFQNSSLSVRRISSPRFKRGWRYYATLYNPWAVKEFKKILRDYKPEIVHFHILHEVLSFALIPLARRAGSKVFLTNHDMMLFHYGKLKEFIDSTSVDCIPPDSYKVTNWQQLRRFKKSFIPGRKFIIKYYLKSVDKIFSVSNELKKVLHDNGIDNTEVLYNGIDVERWKSSQEHIINFIKKYKLNEKKIILFFSKSQPNKGGTQLLQAVKRVVSVEPKTTVVVVGKIKKFDLFLQKKARQLSLESNIFFTGWLDGDELKAAFWSSDVVVTPTITFDSFPTVNLEAMACHKPVVATCFGGSHEQVDDGETGFLVNPFNEEILSNRLITLLKNPQLAKTMGDKGYKKVYQNFDLCQHFKQLIHFYALRDKTDIH